jgi:hypothetical protein
MTSLLSTAGQQVPHALRKALETAFPWLKVAEALPAVAKAAPTNIKTYASTMVGDRSPITEKNLKPDELQVLAKAVRYAAKNKALDIAAQKAYLADLNKDPKWKGSHWNDLVKQELDKYSAGENLVEYGDYKVAGTPPGKPLDLTGDWQDDSWGPMLIHSMTDPVYNLNSTLGRAHFITDPQGNTHVQDTYDFNHTPETGPGAFNIEAFKRGKMGCR